MSKHLSVSFIISYYNLDYSLLERAIQSILNVVNSRDYEIIVVDDGTSESLAENCIKLYQNSRIKYIYQENAGLSEARNTGLRYASKEYIQFVDADDYLFEDGYAQCLRILDEYTPDLLQFDMQKVWGMDLLQKSGHVGRQLKIWNGVEFMAKKTLSCAAWGYCFKKDILGDIRFVKGIYQEDEEFSPRLFLKAETFIKTSIQAYAYYQRENSIIRTTDKAHIDKRFTDLFKIISSMTDRWKQEPNELVGVAIKRRADQLALAYIYNALELGPDFNYALDKVKDMETIGLYPLPMKRYSLRYCIFNVLSRSRIMLRFMRFFVKR